MAIFIFWKNFVRAMVLSKYCVNDESNRNQKNIKTQKDTEGIDGHEKRISTKMACCHAL